ncbi:MAG: BON domain-containing protein [Roseateles sp.]|uniref:BON domain-containing protein n=1 Tax=Roseateles sp. TaxID=1971397 RepID=UPI004036AACB
MSLRCRPWLAGLALGVACQAGLAAQAPAASQPAASAAHEGVAATVRARLAQDHELAGLVIRVDLAGGRVRLRGVAPSTAVRARITALAREAGAVEVVNEVSVQPRPS